MTDTTIDTRPFHQRLRGLRIAGWCAAAALLALPAIAMGLGADVDWTAGDFVAAGIILTVTGLLAEAALRLSRNWAQLIGFGVAIFMVFFTVWSNLAVGIIGAEGEPVNRGFFIVLAAGLLAAAATRAQPIAMAHITGLVAVSQLAIGVAATQAMPGHAVEWGILAAFAVLWLLASIAFRKAAQRPA